MVTETKPTVTTPIVIPPLLPEKAGVIDRIRQLFESGKWARYSLHDNSKGQYCLLGGILHEVGYSDDEIDKHRYAPFRNTGRHRSDPRAQLAREVVQELATDIPKTYAEGRSPKYRRLFFFNDEHKAEDVVGVVKRAYRRITQGGGK